MQRYFFNVRDEAGYKADVEGAEFPDLDAVRAEAIAASKERVAEFMLAGRPLDSALEGQFEVVDETGLTVLTIPFLQAAKAEDHRP